MRLKLSSAPLMTFLGLLELTTRDPGEGGWGAVKYNSVSMRTKKTGNKAVFFFLILLLGEL